jgi:RHS repeat-associated protein
LLLAVVIGAGAVAQVATSTPVPKYRAHSHTGSFIAEFDTLEKAEAAIRANTAYQGAQGELEHIDTLSNGQGRLWLRYVVKERPAELMHDPAYRLASAIAGYGNNGCSEPASDPAYREDHCGNEASLVAHAERKFRERWPNCTITTTSVEYADPRFEVATLSNVIRFDKPKKFETRAECTQAGVWYEHDWEIGKRVPFYCPVGYTANNPLVVDANAYQQQNACRPKRDDKSRIDAPIQQCGNCSGSPNPIYPATGEKQRHEEDFSFAGRSFTRHYRSLRQFRNGRNFAVAWNHTWSDRIISGPSTATAYVHVDETGSYEAYTQIVGSRYRGENSVDRLLERVNANGIGWRLRMPDGEVREFDLDGKLVAIRNPNDPLNDIVITHAGDVIATVIDAQGRVLRFEYVSNLLRRIVLPDATAVSYDYDADRNLVRVGYPGQVSRLYHYNESGLTGTADQRHHLTGITAEDGRRYASFSYDTRGRAVSSRVLGAPNELTTVSYPTEDNASLVTALGDMNDYTIQSGTYRRVIDVRNAAGSEKRDYYPDGRLLRQTDRNGSITEYTYQDGFRRTVTTGVGTNEQRKTETIRDPATGLMLEQRAFDKDGVQLVRSTWAYNGRNQVTTTTTIDPKTGEARSSTWTYCEAADVAAGVCPFIGLLKSSDGPRTDVADVTTYEYRTADASGCVASPEACPYRKGDLWRATNAAGHVMEILRRDGNGRLLSQRDANGVVTDTEYDPRGRPLAQKIRGDDDGSETDDRISRMEYGPKGARSRTIQPDGTIFRYSYDAANRLTTITDELGNTLNYTLDESGRRTREEIKDASGASLWHVTRSFNTLGQLLVGYDAYRNQTLIRYDNEGNKDRVIDMLGRQANYDYDAHGRLLRMVLDKNGIAAETAYRYDALDNLVEVRDPKGLATSYRYNAFGEVEQESSPDTGSTSYIYDSAGNVRSKTDERGVVTAYSYDAMNRLTAVSYPDSSRNEVYAYDAAHQDCLYGERFAKGRIGRMTDASGSTGYCYDRYGNVTRKLQLTQGRTFSLSYLHTDPKGKLPGQDYLLQNPPPGNQMIGWIYPDGARVRIVRDALARPKELRVTLANGQSHVLLHDGAYHPFGPVSRWTFGNGRVLRRSVNQNYQPGFVEDTAPGGISEGYWFDAVGNLESLQDATQSTPSRRRYTHDGLNRLTHVRDGVTSSILQEYTYDDTGNRTSRSDSGQVTAYSYAPSSHRLDRVGGQIRLYDAVGNTTRIELESSEEVGPPSGGGGGGEEPGPGPIIPPPGETESMALTSSSAAVPVLREFQYDDASRMRLVKHDGVVAMSYLYNGVGERVYRTGVEGTFVSVYDQAGHWVGEYDANGQPIQQVIWLDDLPVGLLVGAGASQKLYYIEADALGTPRVVIDPVRNVAVWRWDLAGEAFGDGVPNEDVDNDGVALVFDMRFQGQRFDRATGFNYNYMRDYDSGTGRYVQSDPIGLAGGMSTFGYASGRPLALIDRYGMNGTCPVSPSYSPPIWNREGIQNTNNCYSYAWDLPENPEGKKPRKKPCKPQPGALYRCDDQTMDRSTCQKITSLAIRDGMKRAKNGECGPCMRKVFLVMGHNREGTLDYHWYRQDADGMWSHKPGIDAATNLDASGNPISNPELADRDNSKADPMKGVNYSRKCGYLCVPMQ